MCRKTTRSDENISLLFGRIGLALQTAGYVFVPEHQAGNVIMVGIGFASVGAAGMVGKEVYCFGYQKGWLLAMTGKKLKQMLLSPRSMNSRGIPGKGKH